MNILCTIAAREGSKGVPGKNIRNLNGKPLMLYSIEQAQKCGIFTHVVVTTDSEEIVEMANNYGVETWFLRPRELATDQSAKYPVIKHALFESEKYYQIKYDSIIDLDVTTPLRNTEDIQMAYRKYLDENSDMLISVTSAKKNPYYNMVEFDKHNNVKIVKALNAWPTRRQDAPLVYNINASIYIWKRDYLISNGGSLMSMLKGKVSLYQIPEERSIDIDSEFDFQIVQSLIKNTI